MDVKTSQRIGRIMVFIRNEKPELVDSVIELIESGTRFDDLPKEIKDFVIEKEKNQKL